MEKASSYVIEVQGDKFMVLVPEGAELSEGLRKHIPQTEGIYQWRPLMHGDYHCDPAVGGFTPLIWGWGEGIEPEEKWIKTKSYPVGSLS